MARRGFLAELNYQAQRAEKRRKQEAAAAARAQVALQGEADRARRESERAAAAVARASTAQRAEAQRQAARTYAQYRAAEVAALNADLAKLYDELESLLTSTLDVDDYIDLEALKITSVDHPPFVPGPLAVPMPPMPAPVYPPEPVFQAPVAPTGMANAFGGKKRHEQAVGQARAIYEAAHRQWRDHCASIHAGYTVEFERRRLAEHERVEKLTAAREDYDQECLRRETDAAEHNQKVTAFINDLAFDDEAAIREYVGIVLANSVYPEAFPVTYDHAFDIGSRELKLTAYVPEPAAITAVREYRYIKARDEITSSALALKEQKERYAGVVWKVALRTLHEIFEADRAGKIRSIALTVSTSHVLAATGLQEEVPLAVVAADRDTFLTFDLARVVPHATLVHLGAALAKSPFDMTPADTRAGVRVRGR